MINFLRSSVKTRCPQMWRFARGVKEKAVCEYLGQLPDLRLQRGHLGFQLGDATLLVSEKFNEFRVTGLRHPGPLPPCDPSLTSALRPGSHRLKGGFMVKESRASLCNPAGRGKMAALDRSDRLRMLANPLINCNLFLVGALINHDELSAIDC